MHSLGVVGLALLAGSPPRPQTTAKTSPCRCPLSCPRGARGRPLCMRRPGTGRGGIRLLAQPGRPRARQWASRQVGAPPSGRVRPRAGRRVGVPARGCSLDNPTWSGRPSTTGPTNTAPTAPTGQCLQRLLQSSHGSWRSHARAAPAQGDALYPYINTIIGRMVGPRGRCVSIACAALASWLRGVVGEISSCPSGGIAYVAGAGPEPRRRPDAKKGPAVKKRGPGRTRRPEVTMTGGTDRGES